MQTSDFMPTASAAVVMNIAPEHMVDEVNALSHALAIKFEELTLIHQLSDRLKQCESLDGVCESLLAQLAPCIEAQTLAICLFEDPDSGFEEEFFQVGSVRDRKWLRNQASEALLDLQQRSGMETLGVAIVNSSTYDRDSAIRTVVVPIQRQDKFLGEMIAVRSADQPEFGTSEADLMRSTCMMLGVHIINQRQYIEMQQMFEGTIQSLVSALDAKDRYTCGHSSRVAELAVELAKRLEYTEDDLARIRMAGVLHDIGKIGIEDAVLSHPGKLSEVQFEKIKTHPVLGYEILQGIRRFDKILPAVRHHHESWDGTGYPDGLQEDEIPRDAQVMAVADAFDAMTSDRPYRNGMPLEKVIAILKDGRGQQWAADVVDVLLGDTDLMKSFSNRQYHEASTA